PPRSSFRSSIRFLSSDLPGYRFRRPLMKTLKWRYSIVPVAFLGLSTAMAGCGEDGLTDGPLGDIAAQCGLTCDAKGILEGNASISGNASVDAFFGAVVDFKGAAEGLA